MLDRKPEENQWYFCLDICCNPQLLVEESQEEEENNIEDNIEVDIASLASTILLSDADKEMDYSDETSRGEHYYTTLTPI